MQKEEEIKSLGSSEDKIKSDQNAVSDSNEVCDVLKTEKSEPSESDESKVCREETVRKDGSASSASENEDDEQNYPSKPASERDGVEQDNSVSQSHESDQNIVYTSINTASNQEISQITSSSSSDLCPKNEEKVPLNSEKDLETSEMKNCVLKPGEINDTNKHQAPVSDYNLVQSPNKIKNSEVISEVSKNENNEVVLSAIHSLDMRQNADDIELQSAVSSISRIEDMDTPPPEAFPDR